MNTTPIPTASEFQQHIRDKIQNFSHRAFIFTQINQFLTRQPRGYFTLIGAPGTGKSAILAKYAAENPHVIYYSAELTGKNQTAEFLLTLCTQLLRERLSANGITNQAGETITNLPDNVTEGSWFLSLLLQKISDQLAPNQKLIITIDGCDRIDRHSQPPGSNLFYLPRYLPNRVYFLLSRRPFPRDKSGLLIETPYQSLDLQEYPEQNRQDIRTYIENYLTPYHLNEEQFCERLTDESENNFMYLSQILPGIANNIYPEPFHWQPLPPGLETYYQSHLARMKNPDLSAIELGLLRVLAAEKQPLSVETMAAAINEDEYDVEEVLENWIEFLIAELIEGEIHYRLYHRHFQEWLGGLFPFL
ncbi:ATP-binding protein [Kamptonema sp. UHCC 0994]|uniref:ATP-binding protein n=1 Tax=Kamptonema sp. UHCC 0994 TaxID=3031329 RepID=UPI0023B93093|nr:ATP-binding protein [Kamptonema sp. UHCC 0994]MDF0552034.1 ATP-binding protein [Kamptonema sp. UHCC 0994]